MARKVCREGFVGLFAIAALASGCDQEQAAAEAPAAAAVTVKQSAVTAVTAAPSLSTPNLFRESDVRPLPPGITPGSVPPPVSVPASQYPGHFQNKITSKPTPAPTGAPPPPVPATYIAKQNEYLRQWSQLQPTIANLPIEEQDARRAALKRSVLGD